MAITFQRLALYEEVWSEPLTRLCTKFGLSDNGLRKACKAMNTPVPSVGYRAKLAAGQPVNRTALPASASRTSYTSNPLRPQTSAFHTVDDDAWLAEREEYERRADALIEIANHPARCHPVAAKLRTRIDERLREVSRWRKAAEQSERQSVRQRQWTPNPDGVHWKMFVRDGQLLMQAPLRVTPNGYERALRIANALCFAGMQRGFTVALSEDSTRIRFAGHGATLLLRITERLEEKVIREPAYSGGPLENKTTKSPDRHAPDIR